MGERYILEEHYLNISTGEDYKKLSRVLFSYEEAEKFIKKHSIETFVETRKYTIFKVGRLLLDNRGGKND